MGAWGTGVLEDDAALDWLGDLEDEPKVKTVKKALKTAAKGRGQLDSGDGAAALVAAELVAAAIGRPIEEPRLVALAQRWPELAGEAELAARAVERVGDAERSELAELWAESEDDEWSRVVADLRARLDGQ
jgi:hypothetical protein